VQWGRVKPVTALRNISLLEKFEAKLGTSTPKFVYLFFFRWFYLNLGSLVPVYFFFLIPFVLPNQVISSFSLLHFMFPIWYFKCFLSSSCCSHGHIPVVFFCVMSSMPYPGGFFYVMSCKYHRQIQYSKKNSVFTPYTNKHRFVLFRMSRNYLNRCVFHSILMFFFGLFLTLF